ncbi:substrate-binding and VWA domain-containing protein [Micromonospora peucetia]|uniref:ABC-type molybdate transport system, substrate-binding protein n=1 Tax=Micromonospora peucetia TaxID=47871 RepID=A0A1C6V0P1_9ACTN|nr:substrate-binding and VWA domain-containing protein [Micromonospora peucetia]MCX4388960.1 substrate-binding and VWA domain-containing protein [Micromonospora peucetia]WSA35170.1 substrate-binding and VWA domain-containing protein [Micromonospora peucetia]SCL59875.1 ABC-type molybdate transport system, substrate-binding protein [Micromonospora peucetia]
MLRDGSAAVRRLFRRSPVVLLSAALTLLLAGWAAVAYVRSDRGVPECLDRVRLRVAAAPVVAPALDQIVRASVGTQPCVSIVVQAQESAAVAADVANGVDVADAWVPESTFWLRRARAAGAFEVPAQGTSVASTPVVLAATEPAARRLGWPAKPLTWRSLIGPKARAEVGLPDPAADPAGVGAVLGVRGLAAGERDPAGSVAAVLRRLANRTFTPSDGLPAGSGLPGRADAVATSEQAVLGHNALAGGDKLVAAYPEVAVPALDLPYVVLPAARGPVRDAAAGFLTNLLTGAARDALSGHGFRTAAGFPPAVPRDGRLSPEIREPAPLPAEETVTEALTGWSGVQRSARILTVLDISGSMSAQVPGSAETRLSATLKAAQEGSGLLLDNSELGVWVFATKVDGDRDHREILPVAPLGGTQRERLAERLAAVRVKPRGGTGLYDTTLAAYRDARRNWTPGRINLVLIMTDGRDEDEESIGRSKLLAELTALQDPRRPLPIVFIGLGRDVDPDELETIAEVTGGQVFRTEQPSGIRQIFFSALADLSCLPPECRR